MKKGSVIVGIIMLLTGLMTISVALTSTVLSSSIKVQRQYQKLNALAYAEAGVNRGLWEINNGNLDYGQSTTLDKSLTGGEFDVLVTDCGTDCKYITSTGYVPTKTKADATRTVRVKINGVQNNGLFSFKYGIQAGIYGVNLEGYDEEHHEEHHGNHHDERATVKGSIFSEGPVEMDRDHVLVSGSVTSYDEDQTPSGSYIHGGVISGDARAYTIQHSTVNGTKYSGVYPPVEPMPIPEDQLYSTIDGWEAVAEAGEVFNGNKTLSGNNNALGPVKIDGNLTLSNNARLRVTGTLWVTGNITINNNAKVYLDPSYGNDSGIIIADHKTDRANHNYGRIVLENGATISGIDPNNPKTPSYIMMFSTNPATGNEDHHQHGHHSHEHHNHSYWHGGSAIELHNNALGGVFYAPFGIVKMQENSQARALVGLGIDGEQNATIDYDSGMANSNLAGGPAGKWTITEWLILN